ncbi:MAG: histone deacetylase, partial [Verrucomicrobiae bacterium]|nr:histone deacetylase [Verrucomicrobiae bacterium]
MKRCCVLILVLIGLCCPSGAAESAAKTGFVYDDLYLKHNTGTGHPERAERLTAIVERLRRTRLLAQLVLLKPTAASTQWLTTVHAPGYVERVQRSCRSGIG